MDIIIFLSIFYTHRKYETAANSIQEARKGDVRGGGVITITARRFNYSRTRVSHWQSNLRTSNVSLY